MSRTDKTTPWRVVELRGDHDKQCKGRGYPCKCFSSSRTLAVIKREMRGSERAAVRDSIVRGEDPPTDQHRHRALWDLY